MGFSRQEYWNELASPPPGDLPDPGTEPGSLMSPALGGRFFTTEPLGSPCICVCMSKYNILHFIDKWTIN